MKRPTNFLKFPKTRKHEIWKQPTAPKPTPGVVLLKTNLRQLLYISLC